MSIESFAKRVVELMVAPTASSLLDCLREHQVPEAGIDESEVWIFSLFPFHTMGGLGHFREESRQFGYGLISGTAERMRNRTASTTEHIFERLAEYAQATFDAEELERGQLAILENGLFRLGRLGHWHITGTDTQDIAAIHVIWGHYTSAFKTWAASIKKLYDEYQKMGDDAWTQAFEKATRGA